MIRCQEGYFSVWGFRTTTGYCGTVTSGGTAYAFDGKAGADPVLKKLGSNVQEGSFSVTVPVIDGYGTKAITFPEEFSKTPQVYLYVEADSPTIWWATWAKNITTTGFDFQAHCWYTPGNASTSTGTVKWCAVEPE